MSAALPTNARNLHAITKTATLARDVKGYDERARCLESRSFVVIVSFVVARELVIEDAKKVIVWAGGTEEVKVIGAICSSTKPSLLNGFGSMGVFHVSGGVVG
jgi:hypothetical protein